MTTRIVLLAVRLDDAQHPNADNTDVDLTVARMAVPSAEDLIDGLRARLSEFYPTDDGYPFQPASIAAAVMDPPVFRHLASALEVGLDSDDPLEREALAAADDVFWAESEDDTVL